MHLKILMFVPTNATHLLAKLLSLPTHLLIGYHYWNESEPVIYQSCTVWLARVNILLAMPLWSSVARILLDRLFKQRLP